MPQRRPSGDGMVRKRTDGRWEGRIVVGHKSDGRPIFRSAFGKSQREVMQKLHQLIDVYRGAELDENSRLTLGEWLDRWLDVKGETLRVGTMNKYRHYVESYIKKYIGEKKVSSLSTTEVQKFYNKIKSEGRVRETREHGKEMSDSMVRSIHMMLHEALEDAVREHLAVKNATDGTTVPRQHHKPMQVLGDSGLEKFIASLDGDAWHDFFYTEITTGLRRGEICGLRWSDFDEKSGTLRVCRSISVAKGGELSVGETKAESGERMMILPPSTSKLLAERNKSAASEWIFPQMLDANKPTSPNAAYTKLKSLLKKSGLPDIRFHDLRHTFATHALAAGVDEKTLSGILGHTNASFTLDTYTHVTPEMRERASNIVGGALNDLIGGIT